MTDQLLSPLVDHFQEIPDPRVDRCKQHKLLDIIALTLCASIGGAESWAEIETFGKAHQAWFKRFLELKHGIPSHDTLGRVFARLDPLQFQDSFQRWVAEVSRRLDIEQIAIDGKTLRGSYDKADSTAAIHLVSAWASGHHLSLGQEKVDGKSNEITAIPKLLKLLDLEGAFVTIDAMGCQKEIAKEIKQGGGDYILNVKENQPHLYEDIDRLFDRLLEQDFAGCDVVISQEKGHGREEMRSCYVIEELEEIRHREEWQGLKSIAIVVRERVIDGKSSCEKHYYICSQCPSAEMMLSYVRGHWGIEINQPRCPSTIAL